jgi:hypothetical protein
LVCLSRFRQVSRLDVDGISAKDREQVIKTRRVNDQTIDAKCSEISRMQMTGSKISQMFHVIVTTLCSRHHRACGEWRQINVSNFTFLSAAAAADQLHRRYHSPERGQAGVQGYELFWSELILPLRTFFSSCIRPLLPGHASRVAGVFYG